jgi:hypothetical protein
VTSRKRPAQALRSVREKSIIEEVMKHKIISKVGVENIDMYINN